MATIKERSNILHIDFRWRCKRHFLSTGLKDTKPNRQLINLKLKAIQYDIKLNKLDIVKYFPRFVNPDSDKIATLSEFFEYYMKEKSIRASSLAQLMWAWDKYL
jgi:hypothetical protein